MSDRLILEIEVFGINVEGIQEAADEWNLSVDDILADEVMRREVGVTIVTVPGEKCMNDDFTVSAHDGRVVGARIIPDTHQEDQA